MSYLSEDEKARLVADFDPFVKTFERPISISQDAQKIIISTNPDFNRFEANDLNNLTQNPENSPVSYIIPARILYEKQQPTPYSNLYVGGSSEDAQIKIKTQEGKVRIKINASGTSLIRDAKLIVLDGTNFTFDGAPRQHGIFGTGYTTFYLKRES